MSSRVRDMREALATNLSQIPDVQVSAYLLALPVPPAIQLCPGSFAGEIVYDLAMGRGLDIWPFTVQALVAVVGDQGSQMRLDEFLEPIGPSSIKAAIESDKQLGGLAEDLQVTRCRAYRTYVIEGRPEVLGAEWVVEVYALGK